MFLNENVIIFLYQNIFYWFKKQKYAKIIKNSKSDYFSSIWPPFALIIALRRSKNESHHIRMWYYGILVQSRLRVSFNVSILGCFLVFTLLSKMEKSIGFASGKFESHCLDEINFRTLFFNNYWFPRALWNGAESCWNSLQLKCLRARDFKAAFKTFFR